MKFLTAFIVILVVLGGAFFLLVEDGGDQSSQDQQDGHVINGVQEALISSFSDGFEGTVDEIVSNDRWTQIFITKSQNSAVPSRERASKGSQSMKFFAIPDAIAVSKASVKRKGFSLTEGDHIELSADYYIEDGADLHNLFLMDIECEACHEQNPGVRIAVQNNVLVLERGKVGFRDDTFVSSYQVPTNEWFTVRVQLDLGDEQSGHSHVFVNNKLYIDEQGVNMPISSVVESLGGSLSSEQIDNIEFGATANASTRDVTMYVDNVRVTTR